MQLVSHYLQRPNKARLKSEKNIIPFFDLCFAIQAVCMIVHIVRVVEACKQTVKRNIIIGGPLELQDYLVYKLGSCQYSTTRNMYAFKEVPLTITASDVLPILADLALEMRLAIFVGSVTAVVGLVNRGFVESNVFAVVTVRNFVLWKDVFSALEVLLLAYMIEIAVAAESPRQLLKSYFEACGVERAVTLPFVDVIVLYVFAAAGYLTFVVSGVLYFYHTLPKYGVLNAEEIEQYKARLRHSKEVKYEAKRQMEATKEAHARLQLARLEANAMGENGLRRRKNDDEVLL